MGLSVRVEYFAAARELAGTRAEELRIEATSATVSDVLAALAARHARLATVIHRMRLAINGEIALGQAPIVDGDEVAVLPPVAGGSGKPPCELRSEPLSVDEVLDALRAPDVGGIALFVGTVRNHAGDVRVDRLDYEAHPQLAQRELTRIVEELCAELPGVRIAAVHRVGELAIGDIAVIVGAAAAHRAEAFTACRTAIERIKERVPIWKKEWSEDGSGSWVNL